MLHLSPVSYTHLDVYKRQVVVDDNLNLIDAAFHRNSGGQTANSEDVWGSKLSYLRSVNDTFSIKMPNAKWERKMAKEDWLSYLKLKHNYPIQDSNARWLALTFKQDSRKPYLEANNVKAVSYTHLDVYKRQHLKWLFIKNTTTKLIMLDIHY